MAWRRARKHDSEKASAAVKRLRERIHRAVQHEDADRMLTEAVLADVSDVLDHISRAAAAGPGALDASVINDAALVHRIRAMGLGHPVEELHACGVHCKYSAM